MNIVIKADGSASLTQFNSNLAYSFNEIRTYCFNTITPQSCIFISQDTGFEYTYAFDALGTTLGDFAMYSLDDGEQGIPQGIYSINLIIQTADEKQAKVTLSTNIFLKDSATPNTSSIYDEHQPLLVVDRTIQVVANQVTLVAEDTLSQQIRFKIKKSYDNISFLSSDDANKQIFIDYIPANWEQVKQELIKLDPSKESALNAINFIHSEVSYDVEKTDNDPTYAYLIWNVPYLATINAGSLTIAISIANKTDPMTGEGSSDYLWQTIPAKLTVQPNIGKRSSSGEVSLVSAADFDSRLAALESIFKFEDNSPTVTLVKGGA